MLSGLASEVELTADLVLAVRAPSKLRNLWMTESELCRHDDTRFFKDLFYYFMCKYVDHPCVWCPRRSAEGIGSSGAVGTGGKNLTRVLGIKLRSCEERPVLLTLELPLQLHSRIQGFSLNPDLPSLDIQFVMDNLFQPPGSCDYGQ